MAVTAIVHALISPARSVIAQNLSHFHGEDLQLLNFHRQGVDLVKAKEVRIALNVETLLFSHRESLFALLQILLGSRMLRLKLSGLLQGLLLGAQVLEAGEDGRSADAVDDRLSGHLRRAEL